MEDPPSRGIEAAPDELRKLGARGRSILLANDVGGVKVDSPLFLVSGTADQRVVVERARDLFAKLCDTGQVTEYLEIEGATHDDEYARAAQQIEAWLANRLAGEPATNSCE